MYHGFYNNPEQNQRWLEFGDGKHLSVEKFHWQLNYLKKHYQPISLDYLIYCYKNNKMWPDYSVILTIDDGFKSNYTYAYPILKEKQVPATIFLATDFIGTKKMFWLDQVEYALARAQLGKYNLNLVGEEFSVNLQDNNSKLTLMGKIKQMIKTQPQEKRAEIIEQLEKGLKLSPEKEVPEIYQTLNWKEVQEMVNSRIITIGGHTQTHAITSKCNPEQLTKELTNSKKIIEAETKQKCTLFSYPNGTKDDFDAEVKAKLSELGYECALTTICGLNDSRTNLFELQRLGVDGRNNNLEFVMDVAGLRCLLMKIKKFLM